MKNRIIVDTELNVINYISMVEHLASEFFDENGEYTPSFGKLNAMRLFYNNCVKKSEIELEHNVTDALSLEGLATNKAFISAFNKAIVGDGRLRLDFANAYKDAIEIVEVKKDSLMSAVNIIKNSLSELIEETKPLLSEENVSRLIDFSNKYGENVSTEEQN